MRAIQIKILLCILAVLTGAAAVIHHNMQLAHDAAEKLSQSQAKPFDGGSVRRSLQHYIPK